jgi:hypothetical protein
VLFSKLHVCNGNLEKCRSDRHSCDFSDNNAVLDNFQFRGDTLADEAFALAQRLKMHFTPKGASWLNMIEIEFSVLSKQCLDRRIPDQPQLEREVVTWVEARNAQRVTVSWQFSIDGARDKLKRHYHKCRNP